MKDNHKKYLYLSGVFFMMAVSSTAYAAETYQIFGARMVENFNGQVFLAGTVLFAAAAIGAFCM